MMMRILVGYHVSFTHSSARPSIKIQTLVTNSSTQSARSPTCFSEKQLLPWNPMNSLKAVTSQHLLVLASLC